MNVEFEKLQSIFHAAVEEHAPDQWDAYLDQACAGDTDLRRQAALLLKAHADGGSLLGDGPERDRTQAYQPTEGPGTVIGPYKLLQQIGEGGMGVVWMAEQMQPVQRKVALKVIKPGMDSRQVIARFEAERQALAVMDHVNIARVFDAGATESGRPYFVMELVHGVPITKYCDDNQLTPRERLELFVPVCQAVQHAHQKGIIHRDIKPSNVMITLYDGKPVPKVIDFGVAKATEQKLTERTLFTQYGTMVGTLEYMSPEQAEMSALGVDTRSDIYSLGVLLYELLTGSTPLSHKRLKEAAYAEILRMIKEEEPPKPSTRLSDSGEALASISANRHTEPAKLTKLMRGELDWIVMKALEKDRNRRYETASTLAADVRRYLSDEPVQACPPSATYRVRKFVRRNRTAVAASVSAIGLLLLAVFGLAISNIRVAREKELTKVQRNEAEANFRKARQAVDDQFTLVSQSKLLEVPGLQQLRKDLLESALRYYEDFLQQRPDDPELQAEVAAAYLRLYQIYQALDASTSARAIVPLAKAIDILERLLREYPPNAGIYTPLAGFARPGRALHLLAAPHADYQVALPLFQRATAMWEEFVRHNPAEPGFQFDLAEFYSDTHELQVDAHRPADAIASLHKAQALLQGLVRHKPEAPEYRDSLCATHAQLADVLKTDAPVEDVDKHRRQSLALAKGLATDFPDVPEYRAILADTRRHLGSWLSATGRLSEAEQAFRESLAVEEQLVREFPRFPTYRGLLAHIQDDWGHHLRQTAQAAKAAEVYQLATTNWQGLAASFPSIVVYREKASMSSFYLSEMLALSGHEKEAEEVFQAIRNFTPDRTDNQNDLAWEFVICPVVRFRDPTRAMELARKALERSDKSQFPPGYLWNTLGGAYYRAGDWKAAKQALEKSMELLEGEMEGFNTFFLAMVHWQLEDRAQALKWYEQAVRWLEKDPPRNAEFRYQIHLIRAEAAQLLGIKEPPTVNEKVKSPAKSGAK